MIFSISISFLGCAWFIKLIANYNNNYPYFTLREIISEFTISKIIFIIAIVTIVILWGVVYYYSYKISKKFQTLSLFTYSSSFENICYQFLINKIAKTNINFLKKKSEDHLNTLLLIIIFTTLWIIFLLSSLNSNNIFVINENVRLLLDIKPGIFKTLNIISGISFLVWFTLAPGLHNSFSNYIDKIYKLKSFLPKELGQIQ